MRFLPLPLLALLLLVVPGGGPGAAQALRPAACTEQIANGGFESGAAPWQATSAGGYAVISQARPHTGEWGAFLSGYNNADDRLAQTLTLPAGQPLALSFWWQMLTEETDHPWDKLDVEVTPAGGAGVRLLRITDGDAAGSWQETTFDLSAYAGQTVELSFRARSDSDRPTDFYLDDVSLAACSDATPTATAAPTETATATATATGTPEPTFTPSATATATITATETPEPTVTPSATATATPTATKTPMATASPIPPRTYLPLTWR